MKKLILLVEDDSKNRKLFRDVLQASGYGVIEAADGRTAIEHARTHRPGLILMDVRMPGTDGVMAAKVLKADPDTAPIPIVAITANAMNGDEERIAKAGFDAYMTKPVDIRKFLDLVATYAEG
ncbi:MAG TPA: response regulator [Planctomycetota bacterium]|nr:response regulator [Planctomycetota bacterium]